VPLTRLGAHIGGEYVTALMAGWVCLFFGIVNAKRAFDRTDLTVDVFRAMATLAIVLFVSTAVAGAASFGDVGAVFSVIAGFMLYLMRAKWRGPALPIRCVAGLAVFPALTAVGVAFPYLGWTVGRPDDYATAVELAAVVFVVGVVGGSVAGRFVGRALLRHSAREVSASVVR